MDEVIINPEDVMMEPFEECIARLHTPSEAEMAALHAVEHNIQRFRRSLFSNKNAGIVYIEIMHAIGDYLQETTHDKKLRALMITSTKLSVLVSKDQGTAHAYFVVDGFTDLSEINKREENWKEKGGWVFNFGFPNSTTEYVASEIDGYSEMDPHQHGNNIEEPTDNTDSYNKHNSVLSEYDAYILDLKMHEYIFVRQVAMDIVIKIYRKNNGIK